MTADLLLALAGFALATLFSPGPNNLMLMASGANFGLRRTLPHLLGVALGFPILALSVGLGLGALFEAWPAARIVLEAVSVAFLLWLAWKVATAAAPGAGTAEGRPLTFLQAASFQWVNPKGWAMALGAMSLYAATGGWGRVALVAGVFATLGLVSAATWTLIGTRIRRLLTGPRRLRAFNWTMAALLLGSLWPIVAPLLR